MLRGVEGEGALEHEATIFTNLNDTVWSKNLLFGQIFSENYMKMKEITPTGQRVSLEGPPIESANDMGSGGDNKLTTRIKYVLHCIYFVSM